MQDFSPIIQEANKVAPAHAQISPELVILLPKHEKFPKASKGTLQRGKAYDAFASVIDETYKRYESVDAFSGEADKLQLEPSELLEFILERIRETMQIEEVKADDDLFNLGLTSTQALRVRNLLNTVSVASACQPKALTANNFRLDAETGSWQPYDIVPQYCL